MSREWPRHCGNCSHYFAKECFDEEGEENTVDIGLCRELDHIVWFFTPAEDCDYWERRRDPRSGKFYEVDLDD